jgi:membrane dipeptidase
MAIDLSHTGVRASFEALENSAAPCIVSHSNCRAVHENRRNLPDDLIRAIISADGVIGLNGFPGFVATSTKPTIDDLVDHMVHIDSIAGSGHVGLGLDYWQGTEADYQGLIADGLWHADSYPPPPYSYPAGIEDPSSLMQLTDRLVQRGYTDDEIRGVLGENWARVLETIWAKPSALS